MFNIFKKKIYINLYYNEEQGYYTKEVCECLWSAQFEAAGNKEFIKTIKSAI
jgi:hypothetical protein